MATALRRGATPEVARPQPKRDPGRTETRDGPTERLDHPHAAPRGSNGRKGTLEGNEAHGRIGRSRIGNGAGTLRTRRWSKALKPTAPPPETPPRGDTNRTARDPPRKERTSSTGDAQETPADDHPRGWKPADPKVTCLGRRPRTRERHTDPRRSRDPRSHSARHAPVARRPASADVAPTEWDTRPASLAEEEHRCQSLTRAERGAEGRRESHHVGETRRG